MNDTKVPGIERISDVIVQKTLMNSSRVVYLIRVAERVLHPKYLRQVKAAVVCKLRRHVDECSALS